MEIRLLKYQSEKIKLVTPEEFAAKASANGRCFNFIYFSLEKGGNITVVLKTE